MTAFFYVRRGYLYKATLYINATATRRIATILLQSTIKGEAAAAPGSRKYAQQFLGSKMKVTPKKLTPPDKKISSVVASSNFLNW